MEFVVHELQTRVSYRNTVITDDLAQKVEDVLHEGYELSEAVATTKITPAIIAAMLYPHDYAERFDYDEVYDLAQDLKNIQVHHKRQSWDDYIYDIVWGVVDEAINEVSFIDVDDWFGDGYEVRLRIEE